MEMKGFLGIFFTQQNRRYQGTILDDCIVDLAKEVELRGATLSACVKSFGHIGRLHSSLFLNWPIRR
jgi:PII-like signaling protein